MKGQGWFLGLMILLGAIVIGLFLTFNPGASVRVNTTIVSANQTFNTTINQSIITNQTFNTTINQTFNTTINNTVFASNGWTTPNQTRVYNDTPGLTVGIGTNLTDYKFFGGASTLNQSVLLYLLTERGNTDTLAMEKQVGAGQATASFLRARGNNASVANADFIGFFAFKAHDGTQYHTVSAFGAKVDGTPSIGAVPSSIVFLTSPTNISAIAERLRINGTGSVGIGTTTPLQRLHVAQTTEGNVMRLDDGTEICDIDPDAGGLTVTCSSDAILKNNIRNASSTLQSLMNLKVRQFEMKGSNETKTGFIAQEVALTNPELIKTITNKIPVNCTITLSDGIQNQKCDYLTTSYLGIMDTGILSTASLVKTIQEQQQYIAQLQLQVLALDQRLTLIESKIR